MLRRQRSDPFTMDEEKCIAAYDRALLSPRAKSPIVVAISLSVVAFKICSCNPSFGAASCPNLMSPAAEGSQGRHQLAYKGHALRYDLRISKHYSSDIPSGSVPAVDETKLNRIAKNFEDNGDRAGHTLGRNRSRSAVR
jgi:hypothetical protein